ncbi:MAG: peptidase M23 [Halochromatium sp.]|nr:peptidase M23 [Halochromatium sp.]
MRFWLQDPNRAGAFVVALWVALVLAGCAGGGLAPVDDRGYGPAPPGFYRIRPGDTLSEIAEDRRVSMRKLAAWNDLGPPYPLYAGRLLRVEAPRGGNLGSSTGKVAKDSRAQSSVKAHAKASAKTSSKTSTKTSAKTSVKRVSNTSTKGTATAAASAKPGSAAGSSGVVWAWPVAGSVVQGYRSNDRTRQGIRIAAAVGTAVAAAADGEVVYSGSSGLAGYGNLIIVKHSPRYLSAYGFNRRVLASEGASVKRGQQLAEVGQAADGRPMLHFEIRRDGATVDPLLFLPATR